MTSANDQLQSLPELSWDFLPTILCFMWNRAFLFIRDMLWACPESPHQVHPYSTPFFSEASDFWRSTSVSLGVFPISSFSPLSLEAGFCLEIIFLNKTDTGFYHMVKAAVLVASTETRAPLGCGRWTVSHLLASLVTCSCSYISHCALSQLVYSVP